MKKVFCYCLLTIYMINPTVAFAQQRDGQDYIGSKIDEICTTTD